jgi:hypothetical protein
MDPKRPLDGVTRMLIAEGLFTKEESWEIMIQGNNGPIRKGNRRRSQ